MFTSKISLVGLVREKQKRGKQCLNDVWDEMDQVLGQNQNYLGLA